LVFSPALSSFFFSFFPSPPFSSFISISLHLFLSTPSLPLCSIKYYVCQRIEMHHKKRHVSTPEGGARTRASRCDLRTLCCQAITFTWPHTSKLEFIGWNGFHVCIIVNEEASEYSALFNDAVSTAETA
jgi:hypothetical protein